MGDSRNLASALALVNFSNRDELVRTSQVITPRAKENTPMNKRIIKAAAIGAAAGIGALTLAASPAMATGNGADIDEVGTLIIGGDPAEDGQFPYLTSLHNVAEDQHWCGGSLVTESIVLTAAHCIEGADEDTYKIRHGSVELDSEDMVEYDVTDLFIPDNYGEPTEVSNDWGLMKLSEPVADAELVTLPEGTEFDEGPEFDVAGWGLTEESQYPNEQLWTEVSYIDDEQCAESYGDSAWWDAETMVCAGDFEQGGVGACSADSGGPLVNYDEDGEAVLAGIVSWGQMPCGQPEYPTVFAQVSSFIDDVNDAVSELS